MKNIAIVTGASSGFGKEFVKLFVRRKDIDEVWIISRNEDRLNKIKEHFGKKIKVLKHTQDRKVQYEEDREYGKKIKVFSMDLSVKDNIKTFGTLEELKKCNIKYLVNNAGFAKFCSYDDISIDESVNMIDLNVSGVVAMGLVCIPYMKKGSHIINVASQASFQPLPYQNIYSSTKAFVRNYTRALNVELRDKGIIATAVCPGWMKTELYNRGIIGAERATTYFSHMVKPSVVARKALHDADMGRDISVYSFYVKFCHLLAKILPQKIMMKLWMLQQKGCRLD